MNHILLNPNAGGGGALRKWKKIASLFEGSEIHDLSQVSLDSLPFQRGDRILCAGGDGTLNFALNHLIHRFGIERLREFELGYVGLGSNNSFCRPARARDFRHRIFLRASLPAHFHDLGEVEDLRSGEKRYFISNASFGLLAQANVTFNNDRQVKRLKSLGPFAADTLAFVKTWLKYRPAIVEFQLQNQKLNQLTNFHVMKHRSYAGDYYFDPEIPEADGNFQIHWLATRSRFEILRRFLAVALAGRMNRGKSGDAQTNSVEIRSASPQPLEFDGEIIYGDHWRLRCLKQKANFLSVGEPKWN